MFKVDANTFLECIKRASVGAGKAYVLGISVQQSGDANGGQVVQMGCINSSDGIKTGCSNPFPITSDDIKENKTFYVSMNLLPAVECLSQKTDVILVKDKGSYLETSDPKEECVIRVELLSQAINFEYPSDQESAVVVTCSRAKFVSAIRMGAYVASDKDNKVGNDCVAFRVDTTEKKMYVMSMSNFVSSRAVFDVDSVDDRTGKAPEWHMVNYKFIKRMTEHLTGDKVNIAFNPKVMMVCCDTGLYGTKKTDAIVPSVYENLLNSTEYDFCGKVNKKSFLSGCDIVLVGSQSTGIQMETSEDGTLLIRSIGESNKATIAQISHEGSLLQNRYNSEFIKNVLLSTKEENFYYYGTSEKGIYKTILHFSGKSDDISYAAIVAPIAKVN